MQIVRVEAVGDQLSSDAEPLRAHFTIMRHDFMHGNLMRNKPIGMSVARLAQVAPIRPLARVGSHVPLEATLIVEHQATKRAGLRVVVDVAVHIEDVAAQRSLDLEAGAALAADEGAHLEMRPHVLPNGALHHEAPLAEVALKLARQVREAVLSQAALVHAHPTAYLPHQTETCSQFQRLTFFF
jgi:hypothetical protein